MSANSNPQSDKDFGFDMKQYRESEKQHREYTKQVEASVSNPLLDCVSIMAGTKRQVDKVTGQAKKAVAEHYKDPFKLADFIESKGTPVYVMPAGFKSLFVRFCLFFIGVELGFVAPARHSDDPTHLKLDIVEKLLTKVFSEKPNTSFIHGVFILPTKLFSVGFIAHQLHHWLACMAGLPGYDDAAQAEYKKFMTKYGGMVTAEHNNMSEEEITNLRSAIHREIEALQFLKNITDELFRPMRQARSINSGTANA